MCIFFFLHFSLLFAVLVWQLVCRCGCVLPNYTPALLGNNQNVAEILRTYILQGYKNAEILGFLAIIHGVVINIRTLKRWLNILGLKRARKGNESRLEDIVTAILKEMEEFVGSHVGYREMTRRLRIKHGLEVMRDTVMLALRVIDAEGVQNRRRHRLHSRRYYTLGPNFL